MARLPWFPLFVSDWLISSKIAAMTTEQEGAYLRLLCYQWSSPDCTIPDLVSTLSTMCKIEPSRWVEFAEPILVCFERNADGKLHNPRLTEIRRQQEGTYERRAQAGAKGGYSRAKAGLKPGYSQTMAGLKHPDTDTDTEEDSPKKGRERRSARPPALEVRVETGPEVEMVTTPDGKLENLALTWIRSVRFGYHPCSKPKAKDFVRAAIAGGISEATIRSTFRAQEKCRGKKIYEVLDELKRAATTASDGRRIDTAPTVCRNCGGTGELGGNPCPGCPDGRAKRRAQG